MLAQLSGQVDRFHIYLNGYDPYYMPPLREEEMFLWRSQLSGDRGDAGKFQQVEGDVYFACDDDLFYPADYCDRMEEAIERNGGNCVVSVHGRRLLGTVTSYYRNGTVVHCLHPYPKDFQVHVPGTGVMAFKPSTITILPEHFEHPNMADIWFALQAQYQQVKCVAIAHEAGFIKHQPIDLSTTIHARTHRNDQFQTETIHRVKRWVLFD